MITETIETVDVDPMTIGDIRQRLAELAELPDETPVIIVGPHWERRGARSVFEVLYDLDRTGDTVVLTSD